EPNLQDLVEDIHDKIFAFDHRTYLDAISRSEGAQEFKAMEKLKKTLKQERFADTVALLTMENSSGEISFHVASNIKKVKDPTLKSILKENNLEFGIRQEHRHIIVDTIQKWSAQSGRQGLNKIYLVESDFEPETMTAMRAPHAEMTLLKHSLNMFLRGEGKPTKIATSKTPCEPCRDTMREVNEVLGTLDFEDWDNESAKKGLAVEKVKNWLLPRHIKVKSEPLTENAPRLSQENIKDDKFFTTTVCDRGRLNGHAKGTPEYKAAKRMLKRCQSAGGNKASRRLVHRGRVQRKKLNLKYKGVHSVADLRRKFNSKWLIRERITKGKFV
ncbi:Cytidine deaminase, partial [Folsomia candida]